MSIQPTSSSVIPKVIVRPEEEARAAAVCPPVIKPGMQSGGWYRLPDSSAALAARAREPKPVPGDFGVPSGTRISNYDTILDDTWRGLESKKPPAVVYVLVKGQGGFNHSAVAYDVGGELTVMNIIGRPGQNLVNFLPLKEFLYGVKELDHHDPNYKLYTRKSADGGMWRNPEGGAYHRNHELYAVWEWPEEKIAKMHAYYLDVEKRFKARQARFRLVPGSLLDAFDKTFKNDARESGNCCVWTSRGMVEAGLLEKPLFFPKSVAVDLVRGEGRSNPDNLDIVAVPWIPHARRTHLADDRLVSFLPGVKKRIRFYTPHDSVEFSPRAPFFDKRFVNLSERAAARIVVDPGTLTAHVERQSRAKSRL